jgi:hypothetical protein
MLPGVPLEVEVFNLPGSPDDVAASAHHALASMLRDLRV